MQFSLDDVKINLVSETQMLLAFFPWFSLFTGSIKRDWLIRIVFV